MALCPNASSNICPQVQPIRERPTGTRRKPDTAGRQSAPPPRRSIRQSPPGHRQMRLPKMHRQSRLNPIRQPWTVHPARRPGLAGLPQYLAGWSLPSGQGPRRKARAYAGNFGRITSQQHRYHRRGGSGVAQFPFHQWQWHGIPHLPAAAPGECRFPPPGPPPPGA